jgi:CTP:molybdopterin cytidylyltransferase MocA
MGKTKQLLPLGEKSVIRRCIDAHIEAGVGHITAVISSCGSGLDKHLEGLPLSIVVNDNQGSDMADSIRIGLKGLGPARAVLVSLSDHPLVTAATIKRIIEEHERHPQAIVVPVYRDQRGHPTLFPRAIIEEIFTGVTLRDIVRKDPSRVHLIPVEDKGVVTDLDTPEDYEAAKKCYPKQ